MTRGKPTGRGPVALPQTSSVRETRPPSKALDLSNWEPTGIHNDSSSRLDAVDEASEKQNNRKGNSSNTSDSQLGAISKLWKKQAVNNNRNIVLSPIPQHDGNSTLTNLSIEATPFYPQISTGELNF